MPMEYLKCGYCGGNLIRDDNNDLVCDCCGKINVERSDTKSDNKKNNCFKLSLKKDNAEFDDIFDSRVTLKFEFMPRSTKADINPSQIRIVSSSDDFVCMTECPYPNIDKVTINYNGSTFSIRFFTKNVSKRNESSNSSYECEINGIIIAMMPV